MNSPAHTCYRCAATGQPSLGVCGLLAHPPLAHCSSLPIVPVVWGSGMPIWVTVTATLSLLKVWSQRELRKEPWCWLSQRTQSPAPDWALLPYRLPSSLFPLPCVSHCRWQVVVFTIRNCDLQAWFLLYGDICKIFHPISPPPSPSGTPIHTISLMPTYHFEINPRLQKWSSG